MFRELRDLGFDIITQHHAAAILTHDMRAAIGELTEALKKFSIPVEDLVRGGGGEADSTQRLRHTLDDGLGWHKHTFVVEKIVDGAPTQSESHVVDHVKRFDGSTFALEIEWNNKDPFYDRDLENFKRLHSEGAISVGGIITRGKSLHDSMTSLMEQFAKARSITTARQLEKYYYPTPRQRAIYAKRAKTAGSFARGWAEAFVADKFGEATTHWRKLEQRISRGVGNPCPLLLVGIPATVVTH